LPLVKGGDFSRMLESGREAALALYDRLHTDRRFVTAFPPELDIVVWMPRANRVTEASRQARRIFEEAARRQLHLALANLPVGFFDLASCSMEQDADTITCLRSVLMKPEHKDWLDRIWTILDESANPSYAVEEVFWEFSRRNPHWRVCGGGIPAQKLM
jgi:hypothetical protein